MSSVIEDWHLTEFTDLENHQIWEILDIWWLMHARTPVTFLEQGRVTVSGSNNKLIEWPNWHTWSIKKEPRRLHPLLFRLSPKISLLARFFTLHLVKRR